MFTFSYFLRRIAAAIIDYAVYILFWIGYVQFFGEVQPDGTVMARGFVHLFILFVVWCFYFPFLEGMLGYTLGKGLFGLKVLNRAYREVGLGAAFIRHLFDPVDALIGLILLGVFFVSTRKLGKIPRRTGDLVAGTVVVPERASTLALNESTQAESVQDESLQ